MQMPQIYAIIGAHLIAFFLIVFSPVYSYYFERPAIIRISSSQQKLKFYRLTILMQWLFAIAALWVARPARIIHPPAPHSNQWPQWELYVACVLLVAFFFAGLLPALQSLRSEIKRAAYARSFEKTLGHIFKMLPANRSERNWFAVLAVTAGFCEEVLCRGFLFLYLSQIALHLPLWASWLVSALIFGLNHLYQGKSGVLRTAIGGLALGGLFIVTGNLILPMILHALLDLQVLVVLRPAHIAAAEESQI